LGKYRVYRELAYCIAYVVVFLNYLVSSVAWGWRGLLEGLEEATHDFKRQWQTITWAREKLEEKSKAPKQPAAPAPN
jgi:hypothetical protein